MQGAAHLVSRLTRSQARAYVDDLVAFAALLEAGVLGEFVFGRVMSEISTAAAGGVEGINHVAHLSGAGAGVALVLLLRTFVAALEKPDRAVQLERSGKGGVSFTFNSRRARRA